MFRNSKKRKNDEEKGLRNQSLKTEKLRRKKKEKVKIICRVKEILKKKMKWRMKKLYKIMEITCVMEINIRKYSLRKTNNI